MKNIGTCDECRHSRSAKYQEDYEYRCVCRDQGYQIDCVVAPCNVKAKFGCIFWERKESPVKTERRRVHNLDYFSNGGTERRKP